MYQRTKVTTVSFLQNIHNDSLISSVGYPAIYDSFTDYLWLVRYPNDRYIQLIFLHISLRKGKVHIFLNNHISVETFLVLVFSILLKYIVSNERTSLVIRLVILLRGTFWRATHNVLQRCTSQDDQP